MHNAPEKCNPHFEIFLDHTLDSILWRRFSSNIVSPNIVRRDDAQPQSSETAYTRQLNTQIWNFLASDTKGRTIARYASHRHRVLGIIHARPSCNRELRRAVSQFTVTSSPIGLGSPTGLLRAEALILCHRELRLRVLNSQWQILPLLPLGNLQFYGAAEQP